MNEQTLTELFARPVPEPPLPPGHLEHLLSSARRARRRRRALHTIAAIVLALLLGAGGLALPYAPVAAPDNAPILPDRIEGYRLFTASVTDHPPGRSLALLASGNSGLIRTKQRLAIGADGRTYRDVDPRRGGGDAMLSPDGTAVITAESHWKTTELLHVDLLTGRERWIALPQPRGVRLHAWSRDGRYVSFATVETDVVEASNHIEVQARIEGVLSILDLETGAVTALPDLRPARASAFAPEGDRLAVQLDSDETWIVGLDGARQRRLDVPAGTGIVPGVAWSPDGRLLAVEPWSDGAEPGDAKFGPWTGWGTGLPRDGITLRFVSVDTSVASPPRQVHAGHMLGWGSARGILTLRLVGGEIVESDLDTGRESVLSRLDLSHGCGLLSSECVLDSFQLATGLLATMRVRPAPPTDRGVWEGYLRTPALILLVTITTLALIIVAGRFAGGSRRTRRSSR